MPAPVTENMVGQFVAEDQGQFVVGRRETGHGGGDEQAFAVGPGVEFIGRVQLDIIAAAAVRREPDRLVRAVPTKHKVDRPVGEREVEGPDIGLHPLPGGGPAQGTACQGRAIDADQQVVPTQTGEVGRRALRYRQQPGQVAVQSEPACGIGAQFRAVLARRMQQPAG